MSNAFASAGGSKIHRVDLGTGTSFNVSSYTGYKKFTVDNFYAEAASIVGHCQGANSDYHEANGSATISKSYNASTGALTISGTSCSYSGLYNNPNGYSTVIVHAYLVY